MRSNRVNYWTGEEGRSFEREFARWSGAAQAVAVANGTVALDLVLRALKIEAGSDVVVTPRSFIASASCVVNAGANPVFADVDWESGNLSPSTVEAVLGNRTRAVIPVHLAGWPCNMPALMDLAETAQVKVIEDCAQAHGARVGNRSVGTFGHAGAWSFCQDKIMTTGGEGGMVTTDDPNLWSAMWSFKDHGKSWDAVYSASHDPGFRWVHDTFGTNWRMLEMQAVVGRIQLRHLRQWTRRRTSNAMRLHGALDPFRSAVRVPLPTGDTIHAFYRLYAYVRPDGLRSGWSRDRIVAECQAAGIPVMQGSCSEIYLEKAFDGTPWRPAERLPVARELGATSLMFLVHPTIDDDAMERYCQALNQVMDAATR